MLLTLSTLTLLFAIPSIIYIYIYIYIIYLFIYISPDVDAVHTESNQEILYYYRIRGDLIHIKFDFR